MSATLETPPEESRRDDCARSPRPAKIVAGVCDAPERPAGPLLDEPAENALLH